MNITAFQLAETIGGELYGDPDICISGVGSVDEALCGDVVLAADQKFLSRALKSKASCIVVGARVDGLADDKCIVVAADPDAAFSRALELFRGQQAAPAVGIGAGTVVEHGVVFGKDVRVGSNCHLGKNVVFGDGCVVYPNVYIGDDCSIGEFSRLYPGVVIHDRCVLGCRTIIRAGTVIGSDGFGFTQQDGGMTRLPHAGIVEVGDDVEIGANVTIDRAKTGSTVIGSGTKIDNLVHIAHNCRIGRNCILVAQVGVAGSVKIGNNVTLAGQAGVKDHVSIGDGCIVAARAGVIGDLAAGSVVSGFPARDHTIEKRMQAANLRLPDMLKRLRELEAEIKKLQEGEEEQ
ncbi:MAG: UDP-3-O-(3-hydroxymyristoyl)glucosamine N-acyltransferase [Armatimonadota bacterium]